MFWDFPQAPRSRGFRCFQEQNSFSPLLLEEKKDLHLLEARPWAVLCRQDPIELESSLRDPESPKTCLWQVKGESSPLKTLFGKLLTI